MKRFLLVAMVGISATGAVLAPDHLTNFIDSIYPFETSKKQALNLCMLRDPNFNRLNSLSREACYQHELAGPMLAAARATTRVAPNAVDLHHADAWESAPSNDIRVMEASQSGFTANLADGPAR